MYLRRTTSDQKSLTSVINFYDGGKPAITTNASMMGIVHMNINIKGVRYNPSDETREFLGKKLAKLDFAKDYLHDLDFVMSKEKVGKGYHIDAKMHFSWGIVKIISVDCYELYEGIEIIVDKLVVTVKREKGRVKGKRGEKFPAEELVPAEEAL